MTLRKTPSPGSHPTWEKIHRSGWLHGIGAALVATSLFWNAPQVLAETPEEAAHEILKDMSAYLAKVQNLTLDFSSDIEVISHGGQTSLSGLKLQFSSSGAVSLSRPDKIRASRTGGHSDFEIISDGNTLTFNGRLANAYAQTKAPATLDELFTGIRDLTGVEFPGADLLFSDVYAQLGGQIERAAYIGTAIVDGTECHHLAFRTASVDWQIWIGADEKPFPCKYVVTSKWITGAPQFQLRISNWNDGPALTAQTYSFTPAEGAKAVNIEKLTGLGDLPIPAAIGGK
jgi:hypothetical protein